MIFYNTYAIIPITEEATINKSIRILIILSPKFVLFFFFFLDILYTSINIIQKNNHIYNTYEYNFIGELMIKKYNNIKSIILPSKKINIFVLCILFLGLISGAIFANIIGLNDKNLVVDKIKLFIDNINASSIDSILAFKNSISTNIIYIMIIWILGMTLIGIIFNVFILFIKSFIFGFGIASFILTYSYKGIILSILYLIFGQLLNIIIIMIITIYSIMFTSKLLNQIFRNSNNNNILKFFKNYMTILLISIIISVISALSEAFLLPSLIKIIIKLFI